MLADKERGLVFIAGPCLVESWDICAKVAERVKQLAERHKLNLVYKGSYRKANRTSGTSPRGIGDHEALAILSKVKTLFDVPVTTDVHEAAEVRMVAGVVDLIQIPAFLCRQSELVEEAARSGLPVNIKKGQFLAAEDMGLIADKARRAGAKEVLLTERGTSFGYRDLVVDFRSFQIMKAHGCSVVFDATHSVQRPGVEAGASGGNREFIPMLLRAALAAGVDGLFLETHPDPASAQSDRMTQWPLAELGALLADLDERGLLSAFAARQSEGSLSER
jgi:2-dehydro-3-deoxyphosphooctonate aldolase (KDO 8-P synthase)